MPGIAWFFLVLTLLCLPGNDLPKADGWMNFIFFDKWVHAGLFGILTWFFLIPFSSEIKPGKTKWNAALKVALAVSVWGLTTEFIQLFFIPGRNFDLLDWAADSTGVLIAVILYWRLYVK